MSLLSCAMCSLSDGDEFKESLLFALLSFGNGGGGLGGSSFLSVVRSSNIFLQEVANGSR